MLFGITVVLWLAEPFHHIDAAVISGLSIAALLLTRALHVRDLARLDGGTVLLVMGGIGIGVLIQQSQAAELGVRMFSLGDARTFTALFVMCVLAAVLSALMSNTGTAATLIPVAMQLIPHPSTAIIIALATSFGFPLVISTPANALAVRHGARQLHLLVAGVVAIVLGSLLLALTGRMALRISGME